MKPQETETLTTEDQPKEQETLIQWNTPSFERVPLNEALLTGATGNDGELPFS